MKKINVKEIARLANVSMGTVDRMLHNRGRVAKETEERIKEIIQAEPGLIISVPESIRGLIFDCDGTLVDSMQQHMRAFELAFTDFQETYRGDFFLSARGMQEKEIIDVYNRTYGTHLDPGTVVQRKHYHLRQMINTIIPIRPVVDVVLKNRGKLPMAVVSGGTRANVQAELEVVHIKEYFKAILTADDPIPPKPAPDLFIEAARLMGIPPHQCLVFEDGDLGLEGAQKAGMQTIDVRKLPREPAEPAKG
jgi:HAD superfamily hydrolase (TIGR01509 family)